MSAIIIDVETGSLYGEVIEIGYARTMLNGLVGEPHSVRLKPTKPMDPKAVAVHRITNFTDAVAPAWDAPKHVPEADCWIGHNVLYDWNRLGRPKVKLICTRLLAEILYPIYDSFRLSALYLQLFGVSQETVAELEGLHGAATDVKICGEVLLRIMKDSGVDTIDQLPCLRHPEDWK